MSSAVAVEGSGKREGHNPQFWPNPHFCHDI